MVRGDAGRIRFQSQSSSTSLASRRGAEIVAALVAAHCASENEWTSDPDFGTRGRASRGIVACDRAVAGGEKIWCVSAPAFAGVFSAEKQAFGTGAPDCPARASRAGGRIEKSQLGRG